MPTYPRPTGRTAKETFAARMRGQFVNPPGYEQYGRALRSDGPHAGEFDSSAKVSGMMDKSEHHKRTEKTLGMEKKLSAKDPI